jgi:hypothetical protein
VPSPTAPSLTTSDSVSLPGDPPPDVVKLVKDTATAVVDKVGDAAGLKKAPATSPERKPTVKPPALPVTPTAHPARIAAMPAFSSWALRADSRFSELMPALPVSLAGAAARNPVVATPGAAPATAAQSAASTAVIAERGNEVMRGVLIALAAASAATLAMAHISAVRGSNR